MPRTQLLASSSSPPKPMVQPTVGLDVSKDTGPTRLVSRWSIPANATPPFRYPTQLLIVKPMRGVTVASHFTSVVNGSFRKGDNGPCRPMAVFPTPDQVPLASTPTSQL